MDIQNLVSRNRELQARARALNIRAGEHLFPVMSREQVEGWVRERLAGARRLSEVKSLEALAFPELDAEMVELVTGENPDEIAILGASLTVEYRDGYAPRVSLDSEMISAHRWRELPDAGIKLPGGRSVEVVVAFSHHDKVQGQNVPELKVRCVSRANKSLWTNWPTEGRPAIVLPDPVNASAVVPEIIECQYGSSVIDGSLLLAFGTVFPKDRYYSSDPWFVAKWYQTREEAQAARAESIAKLESIRKEAIQQKQLEEANQAMAARKDELYKLTFREGWYELDADLRDRADQRRNAYLSSSELEPIQSWVKEAHALVAEVEAAFRAKAQAKAAEEARLAEAEKRGELLRELEVTTRYGNERLWVIRPDGSLRERDDYRYPSRREIASRWLRISDELVLVHEAMHVTDGGGLITSGTGIVWQPKELTQAQIAAVERLEGEHGLGGTFEVDPGLVAKRAKMMEEIRKEILAIMPPLTDMQKLWFAGITFLQVGSVDGVLLNREGEGHFAARLVKQSRPFDASCQGREAQIVRAARCAGGMLEFLAFQKWGGWNLSARWRPMTEAEQAQPAPNAHAPSPSPAKPVEGKPASIDQLAELAAKFGRRS